MVTQPDEVEQAIRTDAQGQPRLPPDHVSTRLDAAIIARIERLAPILAGPGVKTSRAIATRACILTGLAALEKAYLIE